MNQEVQRLAAEIVGIKERLKGLSGSTRLSHASLEDSSIPEFDAEGNLVARFGKQADGAYTARSLAGPKPATPAGLTAEGGPASVTVTWDGSFTGGATTPTDFGVVEVWAAQADFTDTADARLLGHFANEDGGEVTGRLPTGDWYVALVCRSQSGRRSDVSERVMVTVESVVDQGTIDELNQRLESMPSITYDAAAPTAADGADKPEGAIWRQVTGGEIMGEWSWDGSVWNERQISNDAVASLEVGKLILGSGQVDELVAQEIWAAKIAAQQVTASEIATETLAADSGFIGVLNSAEIVGAIIKTAESGQRVELDSGHGIRVYNNANQLVLSADAGGNLQIVGEQGVITISPAGIELSSEGGGALVRQWALGEVRPLHMAVGSDRVFICETHFGNVESYDLNGTLRDSWLFEHHVSGMDTYEDSVYILGQNDYLYEYSISGTMIREVYPGIVYTGVRDIAVDDGHIYIIYKDYYDKKLYVNVYDLSINLLDTWPVDQADARFISADNGYIATSSYVNSGVNIYLPDGSLYAHWETGYNVIAAANDGNKFYIPDVTGKSIKVYSLSGSLLEEWETDTFTRQISSYKGLIYSADSVNSDIKVYSSQGEQAIKVAISASTGRLEALSSNLRGVTRADTIDVSRITTSEPPGEGALPRIKIDRPVFPHGSNSFSTPGERDFYLPNPPDGTRATTGSGDTLQEWIRVNGKWVLQNIGWTDVGLAPGWKQGSVGNYGQMQLKDGLVKGRGYIQVTSGYIPSGYNSAFIVPKGMEPPQAVRVIALGSGSNYLGLDVRGADGKVANDNGFNATWISLDSLTWWIS